LSKINFLVFNQFSGFQSKSKKSGPDPSGLILAEVSAKRLFAFLILHFAVLLIFLAYSL